MGVLMQTKNVFISHVHEDDDGLGKLKSLLVDNGMSIRDYSINSSNPNNAKSEAYIKSEILAPRIRDCSTLIVYITPETKNSDYVNWEIEYAQKEGKTIVGVWAHGEKGCEIPQALADYADSMIVGWHGESIIKAINGQGESWEEPNGSPSTPQDIKRYSC
jgi:hypothetical protein